MITIYTNGDISIDGKATGLTVTQTGGKTVLFRKEIPFSWQKYEEIQLPNMRYSLSHDAPATGVPGRTQFEKDLLKIIG